MEQKTFSFSFPDLKTNQSIPPYPEDFKIYVSEKVYSCHLVFVAAFSPKINNLILSDPTIHSINYPFNDMNNEFDNLMKLMYGKGIIINEANLDFYNKASIFFENQTLINAVSEFYICTNSNENILNRLFENYPVKMVELELRYIAKNFNMFIRIQNMMNLPMVYLDAIISAPEFDFDNPHELFAWISKVVKLKGNDYLPLYCHLPFEQLSKNEVLSFSSLKPTDSLSGSLWAAYTRRLAIDVIESSYEELYTGDIPYTDKVENIPHELQIIYKAFPYRPNGHFDGIFAFINTHGNPLWKKYVAMKCGGNKAKYLNILVGNNYDTNYRWDNFSGERCLQKDQWFSIQFLIYKVKVSKYTLCSIDDKPDKSQPKSWRLYASNDGVNWIILHEVINCQQTNNIKPICVFSLDKPCPDYFTYFKFEQLANHSKSEKNKYEFSLNHVEFFGEMKKL